MGLYFGKKLSMEDVLLSQKLESIAAELYKLNETMKHMADILEASNHQMKPSKQAARWDNPLRKTSSNTTLGR